MQGVDSVKDGAPVHAVLPNTVPSLPEPPSQQPREGSPAHNPAASGGTAPLRPQPQQPHQHQQKNKNGGPEPSAFANGPGPLEAEADAATAGHVKAVALPVAAMAGLPAGQGALTPTHAPAQFAVLGRSGGGRNEGEGALGAGGGSSSSSNDDGSGGGGAGVLAKAWGLLSRCCSALIGGLVLVFTSPWRLHAKCHLDRDFATRLCVSIDRWTCAICLVSYIVSVSVLMWIQVQVGDHNLMLGDRPGNM